MYKFNTIGELLDQMTKITKKEEALKFKKAYIQYLKDNNKEKWTLQESESAANANLGYITGYLGNKERERVHSLFQTTHPIFGKTYPIFGKTY